MTEEARNLADENQNKKVKEKAKNSRDTELNDVRRLMNEKWGRRYVWRMLDKAGIFRTSFTGNSTTFFNEGQRNMGLIILGDVNEACPEKYQLMVEENNDSN